MKCLLTFSWRWIGLLLIIVSQFGANTFAQKLVPREIVEITFSKADLPPTLFTMMTGTEAPPCLTVRLPDDFDPAKSYPLLVYVPGLDGGPKGNIYNAQTIAGPKGWIVASLPLFKKSVDHSEIMDGIIVSMEDYPIISKSYQIMLGKIFELVPNIDREKSAMVGFSNGAITIGVLLSCHDEFILIHFKNFCMVDQGMFHLTDLHKKYAKDCRYLILVGDQEDMGRELKIRGSKLQQDSWKLLGVNLTYQIMKDTGHEFQDRHMELVGKWLQNKPLD
jgi:hypothetical protein